MLGNHNTKVCRHTRNHVAKIGLLGQKLATLCLVANMLPTCCQHYQPRRVLLAYLPRITLLAASELSCVKGREQTHVCIPPETPAMTWQSKCLGCETTSSRPLPVLCTESYIPDTNCTLETSLESPPEHYPGGTGGGVLLSLRVWRGCQTVGH